LKERLAEAEHYYEDGRALREMMVDRGEELETTDAEFYEEYWTRRKATEDELGEYVAKLDELALRCEHEGLGTYLFEAQSSRAASASEPEYGPTTNDEADTELATEQDLASKPLIRPIYTLEVQDELSDAPKADGRVESWLANVTAVSPPSAIPVSRVSYRSSPAAAPKPTAAQKSRLVRRSTYPGLSFPLLRSAATVEPSTSVLDALVKLRKFAAESRVKQHELLEADACD
jgi:hypothetical protein